MQNESKTGVSPITFNNSYSSCVVIAYYMKCFKSTLVLKLANE